ncbi:MAG TPA: glycosyltransferase family 39 protein [Chloroflexia bacterium]|nr:glycosyltransferase family 39 protein [Chloroflexia bacterium]
MDKKTAQISPTGTPNSSQRNSGLNWRFLLHRGYTLSLSWKTPLSIFLGWRLGLALLSFAAALLIPAIKRGSTAPYTPQGLSPFLERLLGVWTHWDGEWFLYVSHVGYRPGESTTPFFPLYPILVRVLATLLAGNYELAGVLVSIVAAAATFVLLYLLVKHDYGREVGEYSVLYLAVFPTSFFLAASYSEGLFLALALGAFLAVRRYHNWWLAGLLVGLAAITRNMGILLLLPLGWEWFRQRREQLLEIPVGKFFQIRLRWRWQALQPFSTLAFIGLPVLFFAGWILFNAIYLHDPLNFVSNQINPIWNRHSAAPWVTVSRAIEFFFRDLAVALPRNTALPDNSNVVDFCFWLFSVALFIACAVLVWRRRMPVSYLIFYLVALVLPLFSPASNEPLLSAPRFAIVQFPAFIALGLAGTRSRAFHYIYLFLALLLLAILCARFTNWYWVA